MVVEVDLAKKVEVKESVRHAQELLKQNNIQGSLAKVKEVQKLVAELKLAPLATPTPVQPAQEQNSPSSTSVENNLDESAQIDDNSEASVEQQPASKTTPTTNIRSKSSSKVNDATSTPIVITKQEISLEESGEQTNLSEE